MAYIIKLLTFSFVFSIGLLGWSHLAQAQDEGMREILVDQKRASFGNGNIRGPQPEALPAIGHLITADFAVRSASIVGDTRDRRTRLKEIDDMVENAIKLAPSYGIQLSFGDKVVEDLNLRNFRGYTAANMLGAGRADTSQIKFLIKVPLDAQSDMKEIEKKMNDFVKKVKPVGRAEFLGKGDITLSVVAPDQYRGDVIGAIAKDASEVASRIGADYAVQLDGMQERVEWIRWGGKQVMLYIPYKMRVLPKG
ncbi:hypothetical protein GCM10009096_15790 [Parasphingorhabdus litoris]|uniref:TonB-dependent receptor n=1 Tax=Parasphingorhabdus litoris TaxID=394733 RepID=A0ABN1AF78_9SPHN|nr:TonB-dependent receptor [Parasphingorhabdus litoris]